MPSPLIGPHTDDDVDDNYFGNMDIDKVIGHVPEEAVANGLVPNPTGFDIPMLKAVNQRVKWLTYDRRRLEALRYVLEYACDWVFKKASYENVFIPRIGTIQTGASTQVGVFLFFGPHFFDPIPTSEFNRKTDPAKRSPFPEFVFRGASEHNPLSPDLAENQGLSYPTKCWVAYRLMHIIAKCYGKTPLPKSIWFMEGHVEGQGYTPLLPWYGSNYEFFSSRTTKIIVEQLLGPESVPDINDKKKRAIYPPIDEYIDLDDKDEDEDEDNYSSTDSVPKPTETSYGQRDNDFWDEANEDHFPTSSIYEPARRFCDEEQDTIQDGDEDDEFRYHDELFRDINMGTGSFSDDGPNYQGFRDNEEDPLEEFDWGTM